MISPTQSTAVGDYQVKFIVTEEEKSSYGNVGNALSAHIQFTVKIIAFNQPPAFSNQPEDLRVHQMESKDIVILDSMFSDPDSKDLILSWTLDSRLCSNAIQCVISADEKSVTVKPYMDQALGDFEMKLRIT